MAVDKLQKLKKNFKQNCYIRKFIFTTVFWRKKMTFQWNLRPQVTIFLPKVKSYFWKHTLLCVAGLKTWDFLEKLKQGVWDPSIYSLKDLVNLLARKIGNIRNSCIQKTYPNYERCWNSRQRLSNRHYVSVCRSYR